MKNLLLLLTVLATFLVSCSTKDQTPSASVYKGAEQTIGNGQAYSWAKFSAHNQPPSIGFTLTKGALDNLPHAAVALVLAFPNEAICKIPFDHIMLDYLHTGA